jgi:ATP-dependent RNA helicase RhlE
MLDMGFIHDVRRVIALLPKKRQTLFFSATMPREAQELADLLLRDPETVAVTPPSTTVEKIDQEVLFVDKANKRALLVEALDDDNMRRVLVFTRTKHGANRVAEHLSKAGVHAEAIHGNKSQGARERALAAFKAGKMRVLVATDIAARGIDIDDITHVVNFDLPEVPETYVHRIGRTARAGASGFAMSFCDIEERELLHMIEKTTRQTIPVVTGHPYEPSWASQPYKPTGRPPMNLGKAEAREGREDRHPRDRGRGDHSRDPARSANAPRTGHPPASQTRDGHAHAGGHATHATHATHAAHGGHTAHGGGHAQAPRGGGAPRSGGGGGAPRPGGGNGGDGRGGRRRRGGRGGRGGGGGGGGGGPR